MVKFNEGGGSIVIECHISHTCSLLAERTADSASESQLIL
jgi:hypothetical protein